jgi:hypothetical protein
MPVTPLVNHHRMATHAKAGFWIPQEPLILTAMTTSTLLSPILTSVRALLANPNWCALMEEEYGAMMSNGT